MSWETSLAIGEAALIIRECSSIIGKPFRVVGEIDSVFRKSFHVGGAVAEDPTKTARVVWQAALRAMGSVIFILAGACGVWADEITTCWFRFACNQM
jgi:hypothetical protein